MTRPAPTPPKADENLVDLSSVENLVELAAEERRIAGYLERMQGLGGEFRPTVIEKVRGEYRERLAVLGEKAAPLRAQALVQYRKLLVLGERLASTSSEVEQRRQEKELRRKVGELSDQECAAEIREIEQQLQRQTAEVEIIERTKQRFQEVYPDIAKVAGGAEPPAEPPAPAATSVGAIAAVEPVIPEPRQESAPARAWNKTRVVPRARLVRDDTGKEYNLGTEMSIGREERNQIQLDEPAVSRKHASIRLTPEGQFEVADEDSHYGTFVNEERIERRVLADGDVIRIASVRLTFLTRRKEPATP
ncbi:MAG TPA: FHA domain-containing protein [Candidatus Polarisedimenticolia bacterium]|nr:FHA domain-containing protein [Candidatus Polarisedimenticolia bacterium]